jgi:hypothetical protein
MRVSSFRCAARAGAPAAATSPPSPAGKHYAGAAANGTGDFFLDAFFSRRPTTHDHTRAGLSWLRSRYDGGAVAPGVWQVIAALERHEAWRQHAQDQRLLDAAKGRSAETGQFSPQMKGS